MGWGLKVWPATGKDAYDESPVLFTCSAIIFAISLFSSTPRLTRKEMRLQDTRS